MNIKSAYNQIASSWNRLRSRPLGIAKRYLEGKSGSLLVEGCGSGRHSFYASEHGFEVVGVDISDKMIGLAKSKDRKGTYIVADIRELPFKDKSFDYGLSIAVLHHLAPKELDRALKELARVVKKGALITIWKRKPYGKKEVEWDGIKRTYYFYRPEEFISMTKRHFEVVRNLSDKRNVILEIRPK